MPDLHEYAVGQLYNPSKTSWPEGVTYNYRGGGHELIMFLSCPSPEEVYGITKGKAEFGLLVQKETIFFLYQFDHGMKPYGLPWSDASFQWWLNKPEDRTLPNPEPTDLERALLFVCVVDADTGIIAGMRSVTLSPEFTAALHKAIRQQARTAWEGQMKYDHALARLYARYPTTQAMVDAADITCIGGE